MWSWLPQYGHPVFIISTVVAAVCSGIGIGGAFVSAIVGYQLTEAALGEANERIAVANARGEEAKAQVETAQADIAKANVEISEARRQAAVLERETAAAKERTAALEQEATEARKEQEKLKAQLAWRRISQAQHDQIVEALRGRLFRVHVTYPSTDPEAMVFADDIARTLQDAGLQVEGSAYLGTVPVFGLGISKLPNDQEPGPDWVALADAFKKSGWTFGLAEVADRLTITVGSKKPPF
jgi:multidrug efflux pump subunit AcrA (membrane-fusion protein)